MYFLLNINDEFKTHVNEQFSTKQNYQQTKFILKYDRIKRKKISNWNKNDELVWICTSEKIFDSFFDVENWSLRAMHCEIFRRCELINETITQCTNLCQQNVMKYVHNFSSILLFNFNQKIICYFRHMKNVWSSFFDHDKNKIQLTDRVIVEIIEFTASQTFKRNIQQLLNQIQNDEKFKIFNKKNRNQIWNKLIFTKHFISFFRNFFKNVKYLNALTNNVKLLINLASNDIIFVVFSKTLNQEYDNVIIQTAEFSYWYQFALLLNKMNLSWRQLMIFAMRNYRDLFKRSKKKLFWQNQFLQKLIIHWTRIFISRIV